MTAGNAAVPRSVAVLGAGAGGTALAVDLALLGADVVLWDRWDAPEQAAPALRYDGVLGSGTVAISRTTDLGAAVAAADLVVVATLATAQGYLAPRLAAELEARHTVVAACGGLTSLRIAAELGWPSGAGGPLLGELSCFPYSARFGATGEIVVRKKRRVAAAAWPASATGAYLAALGDAWIRLLPAVDVLHCALGNPNYVLHPAAVVTNLASYDRGEQVPREGLTPGTQPLVDALDADRTAIVRALGYPAPSLAEIMAQLTDPRAGGAAAPAAVVRPEGILPRFVEEDVGLGLCLLAHLARVAAVPARVITPLLDVVRASVAPGQCPEAFAPAPLGWDGADAAAIRASLDPQGAVHGT